MSNHARRIVVGLVLSLVSVAVGTADATSATPSPTPVGAIHTAATAVTCNGNSCDGEDPVAAGCTSGAIAYAEASVTMGTGLVNSVAVYYSPACGAGYAEFDEGNRQNDFNNPPIMSAFWVPQFGGPEQLLAEGSQNGDLVYSVMIQWDTSIKACYVNTSAAGPLDSSPDPDHPGSGFCTRWT